MSLGSFTYGFCSSIIATTLGQPDFYQYLHLATEGAGLSHTNAITGAMNGLFQAAGIFGALVVGPLCDKLSRRGGMGIAAVVCLIGGALQCGSVNQGMFLFGRLLTGKAPPGPAGNAASKKTSLTSTVAQGLERAWWWFACPCTRAKFLRRTLEVSLSACTAFPSALATQ